MQPWRDFWDGVASIFDLSGSRLREQMQDPPKRRYRTDAEALRHDRQMIERDGLYRLRDGTLPPMESTDGEKPQMNWSCVKQFVLETGELDVSAESELYKLGVRRNMEPGTYRWATFVEAATAIEAGMISNQRLVELVGDHGVAVWVWESSTTLVRGL